ncbi:MAG: hypothetical protein ACPGU1_07720 [Myxococcota bacterium]
MADGKDKQDVIIARLDTLISAVNRLAEVIEGSGADKTGPVSSAPEVAEDVATVAATVTPAPRATESGSSSASPPARDADTVEVIVDEQVVSGVPGASSTFSALLARMFEAALQEDTETAWLELTALTHPKELFAPRALDSLKAFSWKQMRKNAMAYLNGTEASSFSIARTDPAEPRGDELRMKVFLNATGRSPAPVTLIRDEAAGGAWRLGQVSL